ncbi:hypothetical protein BVRB_019030, partial [Beta vulgaris subsp. vulgaris]
AYRRSIKFAQGKGTV